MDGALHHLVPSGVIEVYEFSKQIIILISCFSPFKSLIRTDLSVTLESEVVAHALNKISLFLSSLLPYLHPPLPAKYPSASKDFEQFVSDCVTPKR